MCNESRVKSATKGFCGSTRRKQTGGEANVDREVLMEIFALRGWSGATMDRGKRRLEEARA